MLLKVVYTSSLCNHLLNNRIIFKERIYIDDVHDIYTCTSYEDKTGINYSIDHNISYLHTRHLLFFSILNNRQHTGAKPVSIPSSAFR